MFVQVEILVGADKGKQGLVNSIINERNWVYVEGLNCVSVLKYSTVLSQLFAVTKWLSLCALCIWDAVAEWLARQRLNILFTGSNTSGATRSTRTR